MKKLLWLGLIAAVIPAAPMFGQSTGGAFKDGHYTLEERNYDHGYRGILLITVKGGKIADVRYDYYDRVGKAKTKDQKYQEAMFAKNKVGPQQYIPTLNNSLRRTQDPTKVDVITGATHSSVSFKEYAAILLDAARKGDTKTIYIDNAAEE
jgi:major membrane immunogen (membrane-anchored lipoprotein)